MHKESYREQRRGHAVDDRRAHSRRRERQYDRRSERRHRRRRARDHAVHRVGTRAEARAKAVVLRLSRVQPARDDSTSDSHEARRFQNTVLVEFVVVLSLEVANLGLVEHLLVSALAREAIDLQLRLLELHLQVLILCLLQLQSYMET